MKRMWETVAQEWVTVLDEPDGDGCVLVQYGDGRRLRVGAWILSRDEE